MFEKPALELARKRLFKGLLARNERAPWKGALIQWEEENPPGNCCSSRKQSERGLLETAKRGAFDAKGAVRPHQRASRP